jgi:hypothetical protein
VQRARFLRRLRSVKNSMVARPCPRVKALLTA